MPATAFAPRQSPAIEHPAKDEVSLKFSKKDVKLLRDSWNPSSSPHHVDKRNLRQHAPLSTPPPTPPPKNYKQDDKPLNKEDDEVADARILGSEFFWIQVYDELIHGHPEVHQYQPTSRHMTVQFSSIMLTAMENLEDLSPMRSYLQKLGRMHTRVFNVERNHFEYMGNALLDVLERNVSDPRVVELWMKLYCFLANSMLKAGYDLVKLDGDSSAAEAVTFYHMDYEERKLRVKRSVASSNNANNTNNKASSMGVSRPVSTVFEENPVSAMRRDITECTKDKSLSLTSSTESTLVEEPGNSTNNNSTNNPHEPFFSIPYKSFDAPTIPHHSQHDQDDLISIASTIQSRVTATPSHMTSNSSSAKRFGMRFGANQSGDLKTIRSMKGEPMYEEKRSLTNRLFGRLNNHPGSRASTIG